MGACNSKSNKSKSNLQKDQNSGNQVPNPSPKKEPENKTSPKLANKKNEPNFELKSLDNPAEEGKISKIRIHTKDPIETEPNLEENFVMQEENAYDENLRSKKQKKISKRIFHFEEKTIVQTSHLFANPLKLQDFDGSMITWLEKYEEDGVRFQNGYDKHQNKYIAIKEYLHINDPEKKEEIKLENDLLQSIEKIRSNKLDYMQYFLKYDGAFNHQKEINSVIFKTEYGVGTLENVLNAGKTYDCSELLYVLKGIIQTLVILEQNQIAHRDIKPKNIILVENPNSENGFFYKISDFGIGCKLKDGTKNIPASLITETTMEFAAPEVVKLFESEILSETDTYNPFLADVFSMGIVVLKMIKKSWGRKNVLSGDLFSKGNFNHYEAILEPLQGMLEEDPKKRWELKRILNYLQDKEKANSFSLKCPTKESEFFHLWLVEKEKKNMNNLEDLEILFEKHRTIYGGYIALPLRPKETKFHLEQAWDCVGKMTEIMEKSGISKEKKMDIKLKRIMCLNYFGDSFQKAHNFESAEQYLNQARIAVNELKTEIENGKVDETRNKKILWLEADLMNLFGDYCENKGERNALEKAEEFYLKSYKAYESILGEKHSDVAISIPVENLGNLYQKKGDHKKAEEFFLKSLKIRTDLYGENNSYVAGSLNNIAALYGAMNELSKSEEYFLKSIKIYQNILGENNSYFAGSLENMGLLYENLRDFNKAEEFYFKSLHIRQTLFGECHPEVANSLNNLGVFYKNSGDFEKAIEYHTKSLEMRKKLFGEIHSDIAMSLKNLGTLYEDMKTGNHSLKAEEYYMKSLKVTQSLIPENLPAVALSLNNLGLFYSNINVPQKGEEPLKKSLEIYQQLFGEEHEAVATALNNLALIYEKMGETAKSIENYLESLRIYRKINGENHNSVATCLNNLGNLYKNDGKLKKAEELFLQSLAIKKQLFGENHSEVAMSLNNLSYFYEIMKNKEIALSNALQAYEMMKNLNGESHPTTVDFLNHYEVLNNKKKKNSFKI